VISALLMLRRLMRLGMGFITARAELEAETRAGQ
jgi:hypothetical protein